jgi:hypothetical protein
MRTRAYAFVLAIFGHHHPHPLVAVTGRAIAEARSGLRRHHNDPRFQALIAKGS